MTHTIEGDNIHFTFISPEGKQRKITLSLSEDGDLVNQILSIKDRTSREAALGYLFVNGQQEPRSETQLLSLTEPQQDVLTIQNLQNQYNTIDDLIESLKEKMKAATPEQKKEYAKRIKELEKDKKRLQQQADLIKNKTHGRTQTSSTLEQLLTIASNPETILEKFENTDEFKKFIEKVEEDIKTIKTAQGEKLYDGIGNLKQKLTVMDKLLNSKEDYNEKIEKLTKFKNEINADWERIKTLTEEVKQEMEQQTQKAKEQIEESNNITEFLKTHQTNEPLTIDNLKENLQFVIDNLNERTATDENFKAKIKDIINKLSLNNLYAALKSVNDASKLYADIGRKNAIKQIGYENLDHIVPTNIYDDFSLRELFIGQGIEKTKIGGWSLLITADENIYKPWKDIVNFINKVENIYSSNLTGQDDVGHRALGFKDIFTSKKVKENIQSNNDDIKTLKSQISDLKEELTEIKNLIKAQQQPIQQPHKNFQNYLKDIENITLSKLRHTEPNQRPKEEPNEIAKKILDRRNYLEPDYSTDDDEPWDD